MVVRAVSVMPWSRAAHSHAPLPVSRAEQQQPMSTGISDPVIPYLPTVPLHIVAVPQRQLEGR